MENWRLKYSHTAKQIRDHNVMSYRALVLTLCTDRIKMLKQCKETLSKPAKESLSDIPEFIEQISGFFVTEWMRRSIRLKYSNVVSMRLMSYPIPARLLLKLFRTPIDHRIDTLTDCALYGLLPGFKTDIDCAQIPVSEMLSEWTGISNMLTSMATSRYRLKNSQYDAIIDALNDLVNKIRKYL